MTKTEMNKIVKALAKFTHDPLGFVKFAFPWGQGELKGMQPEQWQVELLTDIRDGLKDINQVIREATASGHGIGKLNSYSMELDTPSGKMRWGDLNVGDYVFGADGKPTKIIQTHHYKDVPMYRVTFDDDSYCDVSSGHLWNVKSRNDRRAGRDWQTLSTLDILNKGVLRKNGKALAKQWEIPIQGAAEFPHRDVPLHPYLVGVWLGDGSRNTSAYTKPYLEVKAKIATLGYIVTTDKDGKHQYIHGIKHLMTDDVFTHYSCDRYIPDDYKYNDVDSRKELLCGLLDTDGEINSHSSIIYSTTSKRLADDVLWLVRSLGGKAQYQPTNKQGWYYNDKGKKVICKECYRITMTLPFNPFTIEHRKCRYKENTEHRYMARWIASIEPIENQDGMCITVEAPDGLYLANDFIVTHNSAFVAWLCWWAMSTKADTRGVVTANTETQLRTKTWAEITKWYNRFIAKDFFKCEATSIYSVDPSHQRTWRLDAIPWSESNTEAFAGLHNQGKRILLIFDEASAIADTIWEVAEGAMTDANTEILWLVFGNPTRNVGRFYDCFHRDRDYWHTRKIDSREVSFSNKELLNGWIEQRGIDSDFCKVRILGEFPNASDNQLIPTPLAEEAYNRKLKKPQYSFAPIIIGVDPAWTGTDEMVICMRQGLHSEILETIEKNDNDMEAARKVAKYDDQLGASAVFIDQGYGTGIYSAGKDMGRNNWKLVNFAEKATKEEYANKRAEMWFEMKEWLLDGGSIDNSQLRDELTKPEAFINRSGKHQLESKDDMKRRGVASPNMADALALTFAFPVRVGTNIKIKRLRSQNKLHRAGAM